MDIGEAKLKINRTPLGPVLAGRTITSTIVIGVLVTIYSQLVAQRYDVCDHECLCLCVKLWELQSVSFGPTLKA